MTARTYESPSVRRLAKVVDRVAPRGPGLWDAREPVPGARGLPVRVSRQRADQLWMVLGMFDRALKTGSMPGSARVRAEALFTEPVLRGFWELAESGALRALPDAVGRRLSLATMRVVRDVLGLLAGVVVPGKRNPWTRPR
ncbi:hypothetical protein ABZO31_29155 [Streptomyces sp. HUAS MG47]|uniref:hypothetical protein n=1 Tax=Streptomyces solicamelliae TaxID=3231716 RepID=UPI003877F1CE